MTNTLILAFHMALTNSLALKAGVPLVAHSLAQQSEQGESQSLLVVVQSITNGAWVDTAMSVSPDPAWTGGNRQFYWMKWDSSSVFMMRSTNLTQWAEYYRGWVTNANLQQWRLRIE